MSDERLVHARVDATTAGPLVRSCPVCDAQVNASCTVLEPAEIGDVRGIAWVRAQVPEFHQGRVEPLPVGGESDGE